MHPPGLLSSAILTGATPEQDDDRTPRTTPPPSPRSPEGTSPPSPRSPEPTPPPSPRSQREPQPSWFVERLAGLTQRAVAGRVLAGAGAVLLPIFLFLPYASVANQTATGWQALDPSDVIMTVSTVAMLGLLATELLVHPSRGVQMAVACICFLSLGLAWPDFLGIPAGWDAGAVLTLLTALAACAGALITLAEPLASRPLSRSFHRALKEG